MRMVGGNHLFKLTAVSCLIRLNLQHIAGRFSRGFGHMQIRTTHDSIVVKRQNDLQTVGLICPGDLGTSAITVMGHRYGGHRTVKGSCIEVDVDTGSPSR